LIIPESSKASKSNNLERAKDSFERLVEARKKTVRCLVEVAEDIVQLDHELKTKKAWSTAASVAGNCLKTKFVY
jgi:hypothetical protein